MIIETVIFKAPALGKPPKIVDAKGETQHGRSPGAGDCSKTPERPSEMLPNPKWACKWIAKWGRECLRMRIPSWRPIRRATLRTTARLPTTSPEGDGQDKGKMTRIKAWKDMDFSRKTNN